MFSSKIQTMKDVCKKSATRKLRLNPLNFQILTVRRLMIFRYFNSGLWKQNRSFRPLLGCTWLSTMLQYQVYIVARPALLGLEGSGRPDFYQKISRLSPIFPCKNLLSLWRPNNPAIFSWSVLIIMNHSSQKFSFHTQPDIKLRLFQIKKWRKMMGKPRKTKMLFCT